MLMRSSTMAGGSCHGSNKCKTKDDSDVGICLPG